MSDDIDNPTDEQLRYLQIDMEYDDDPDPEVAYAAADRLLSMRLTLKRLAERARDCYDGAERHAPDGFDADKVRARHLDSLADDLAEIVDQMPGDDDG